MMNLKFCYMYIMIQKSDVTARNYLYTIIYEKVNRVYRNFVGIHNLKQGYIFLYKQDNVLNFSNYFRMEDQFFFFFGS